MIEMARLAQKAAAVIEKRGLYQGDFSDPWTDPDRGAVCAVGALRLVMEGRPDAEPEDQKLFTATVDAFARFLGVSSVPDWSDEAGRTKQDIAQAFRRFSASVG
ncbi:hypothetical protein ABZ023_34685 [Streptomyces sp. NPDC006367]|uniref:DUF6197 family protein n=1 Tax=unclassified Streptomyces TaxID=2593676 RepID=UPI0033A9FDB5